MSGSVTSSGPVSSGSSTSTEVLAGNISVLNVGSNSISHDLSDVTADEDVMVVLYNYSDSDDTVSFQLSSVNTSYLTKELTGVGQDSVADFHDMLRGFEKDVDVDEQDVELNKVSSAYLRFSITVGDTKTFKVLNSVYSSSSYDTVTAELRYSSNDVEFYVDVRDADAVTDTELQELADGFSITEERCLFGDESDVDGNGKFAVLFSRTVNELGNSAGGTITGFFYAADLFSSSLYPISNEMEIYYTMVPDVTGEFGTALSKDFMMSNIYPTVLPHEFQHMISFNQHYFLNGGASEEGWLNEALSHLAEDMININASGFMAESSVENPSRISSYLANIQNICFSCGSSLTQRGGSYLFIRYLYEQAQLGNIEGVSDGAAFLERLMNTDETGLDNVITALFGVDGTDDELKVMIGKFALTIYLSNSGSSSDNRFEFTGIDLRAAQEDNRSTLLNGPALQDVNSLSFADTLEGISMTYLKVSGQDILDNGGTLNISFSDGAEMGGYLIRE